MKLFKSFILSALFLFAVLPASHAQVNLNKLKNKANNAVNNATKITNNSSENQSGNTQQAAPVKESSQAQTPVESSKTFFVSISSGSNGNDGSKENPYKNIDKAIKVAAAGDVINVAGGTYMGTLKIGFLESKIPLKIYGSWDESFTTQDIKKHPTTFQPNNETARSSRKALLKFTSEVNGTVIDHMVFDSGERNSYSKNDGIVEGIEGGRLLAPTEKPLEGYPTVGEPLIQFVSATKGGDVTIQNCVFVNGASFAVQAGHRSGKFTVKNNVFVANKMAAVEVYGTCASTGGPGTMSNCGEVEIANNTILFTWSRLKDFKDMGYGVRIMTKCEYNIHHNIIGGSILSGVDHTRFNKDEWIKVDNNIFFVNKDEDLHYSPASNTRLRINAADFGDLEFASAKGNKNEIPEGLKVDKAYLEGYLSARYSEQADYNPNSPANQWREAMGMNKQGTLTTSVTMFMNKYPWKDALNLFGSVSGYGAQ